MSPIRTTTTTPTETWRDCLENLRHELDKLEQQENHVRRLWHALKVVDTAKDLRQHVSSTVPKHLGGTSNG